MEEEQKANDASNAPAEDQTGSPRKQPPRGLTLKVSEKGGLSVYGLGRFPVTLYKEQWARLLGISDEIRAFIKENDSTLKSKSQ